METVLCPSCKKEVKWDIKSPFCPFCCERCKTIDLGAWASNAYGIPDQPVDIAEIERLMDKEQEDKDPEDPSEHE
jgi:endogenous inhibitor of DNA gyrase (YacG/DUF329 family)